MTGRLSCDEVRDLAAPFVLGALDADEAAAVREHLRDCAEPHPEFLELGSVVPALAESVEPVEPPAELKARILAAAAADGVRVGEAGRVASGLAPAPAAPGAGPEVPVATPPIAFPSAAERVRRSDTRRPTPAFEWVLRIAAVLAIVVLGGWNLLLQGRIDASEAYNRDVAAVLDSGAQPGALVAVLAPTSAGGPIGLAAIAPTGAVTLAVRDLEATTGSQVYEAWSIVGDAAPTPLGGFAVGGSGTGRLDGTGVPGAPGTVLALTLESGPGATIPTLPILAIGTAFGPPAATGEALLHDRLQPRIATVVP